MSEKTATIAQVTRWSLFVLVLPLSAFISSMGWVGTAFGSLTDSIPLLLVFPIQVCAFYSFRVAAIGLWRLLAVHLLLPFRFGFHSLAWNDLAPARIDPYFWAIAIFMGAAAWISSRSSRNHQLTSDNS